MQMREFGRTGLNVSALAFGCGRVGGLLVEGSESDQRRAFDAAIAGGITWFDTAEVYGSEDALGRLLAASKADVNVSTKVTLDPKSHDLAGDIERQADACLRRLKRDAVTVLQVHNRIDDAGGGNSLTVAQMTGPVLGGLTRVQNKGKTRLVGLTALGDTASILRVMDTGAFQSAQVYYNAINPSSALAGPGMLPRGWSGQDFGGVIATAQKHGMGMLGIRILDGGIIATDDRAKPVSMMARETTEAIEQRKTNRLLAELQRTHPEAIRNRAQFGVRFALSQATLSTAVVGIGAPGHVDQALAAEAMGPLPQDVLDAVAGLYETDFA
ncbi:MAG: aldo/keto reductase [Beijerinckiaceae bacterium]